MSYKPSDTMNLVHEVKKLGWHFTHSKENISINRHDVTLSLYRDVDPEAWRDEYRKKQAAGVKFQNRCGYFWQEGNWNFEGNKEDYREVPQEASNVKEAGVGIPEASREVLKQWQAKGLKFNARGVAVKFTLEFTDIGKNIYTISEQPIPEGMSVEAVEAMWRQGLRVEYNHHGKAWRDVTSEAEWNRGLFEYTEILQCLRIPAQPIPEKMLEDTKQVLQSKEGTPPPHAAERALWEAQREAGTNEVWQFNSCSERGWIDIPINEEPNWMPNSAYRVKPMKLTAVIVRKWSNWDRLQDWEFTGTREEYRAECEKYGYVVVSEIKEVKPKTVKYYFALCKTPDGRVGTGWHRDKQKLTDYWVKECGYTIIGDIEEREV